MRPGERIADTWKLRKLLGKGGFGEVFSATDENRKEFAVKIEFRDASHNFLRVERDVYKVISAPDHRGRVTTGVPRMFFYGRHDRQSVMVLDRLGPSLETRVSQSSGGLSLKTCLIIAVQAIRRLEHVHNHGFIHRDIKPSNILTGNAGNDLRTIYIVDFGAAKRYLDPRTNEHIPRSNRARFIGTARFASIRSHQMADTSRRDDMESLGYSLLQLLNGSLPWQGLGIQEFYRKHHAIMEMKKSMPLREMCKGFSGMFGYMSYVRGLRFDETPNYSYMRDFFRTAMKRHRIVDDGMYDWLERI